MLAQPNMNSRCRVNHVIGKRYSENHLRKDVQLRRISQAWQVVQRSGYLAAKYHGKMRIADVEELEHNRIRCLQTSEASIRALETAMCVLSAN